MTIIQQILNVLPKKVDPNRKMSLPAHEVVQLYESDANKAVRNAAECGAAKLSIQNQWLGQCERALEPCDSFDVTLPQSQAVLELTLTNIAKSRALRMHWHNCASLQQKSA